jgi:hypothetical protein
MRSACRLVSSRSFPCLSETKTKRRRLGLVPCKCKLNLSILGLIGAVAFHVTADGVECIKRSLIGLTGKICVIL